MMLGAQALRTKQKAEKREREKRKQKKLKGLEQERDNLRRAAKRFGEAATSALLEYSPSLPPGVHHHRPGSARTHSIYDFSLSSREKNPQKLIKPRFSLNVGSLSARDHPRPSPSFDRIHSLLLSPRSASGGSDLLFGGRPRSGSGQSSKSSASPTARSSISSAGTRLLRWLGILSNQNDAGKASSRNKSAAGARRRKSVL